MSKRVLIVDDSIFLRQVLSQHFVKHLGWTVCGELSSGEGLIEAYAALSPDLITLDINMPKVNGIEALKSLLEAYPKALVLIITSARGPEVEECRRLGAKGVLHKPMYLSNPAYQQAFNDAVDAVFACAEENEISNPEPSEVEFKPEIFLDFDDEIQPLERMAKDLRSRFAKQLQWDLGAPGPCMPSPQFLPSADLMVMIQGMGRIKYQIVMEMMFADFENVIQEKGWTRPHGFRELSQIIESAAELWGDWMPCNAGGFAVSAPVVWYVSEGDLYTPAWPAQTVRLGPVYLTLTQQGG